VEKKFKSRKNNVFLLKSGKPGEKIKYLVQKEYSYPARMPGEVKMLRLLKEKGVPVPQIYGTGENYILLEYLEGPLFADFFP
jgi:tRNA A-37 threonylcarbamoyl transferase component Bud32